MKAMKEDKMQGVKVVKEPVPLKDGVDKVTGIAQFVADVQFPGMLHVKCVRSPYAHAEIVRIDTSKAEKLPGVVDILTFKDTPERPLAHGAGRSIHPHRMLDNKVRCVMDEVVAVAAVDEYTAMDAV